MNNNLYMYQLSGKIPIVNFVTNTSTLNHFTGFSCLTVTLPVNSRFENSVVNVEHRAKMTIIILNIIRHTYLLTKNRSTFCHIDEKTNESNRCRASGYISPLSSSSALQTRLNQPSIRRFMIRSILIRTTYSYVRTSA